MKVLKLILLLLLLSSTAYAWGVATISGGVQGASNSYTVVRGGNSGGYSSDTSTVQLTSVGAGHVIVVIVGWLYNGTLTPSCSDGTSSFTAGTQYTTSIIHIQAFYLLSSVATGTVTYTVTCTGGTFIGASAFELSCTGTPSLDTQGGQGGTSTSISSGNITASNGSCVVGGAYSVSGNTISALLINGSSPDGGTQVGFYGEMAGAKAYTTGFTGAATATLSGSGDWIAEAISFK